MANDITWISFDDTLPVPVLSKGYLLTAESIKTLFSAEENEIRWDENGCRIAWIDPWGDVDFDEEAETVLKVEKDGVELYKFQTAPYQFNDDTETMEELGYTAEWVPQVGFVLTAPETSAEQAAERIIEGINRSLGRWIPVRANSWTEYAAASHDISRDFFFAGLRPGQTEKEEQVARMVGKHLRAMSEELPREGTVTAEELVVGDVVDGKDVRWHSSVPGVETFTVTSTRNDLGTLHMTFRPKAGQERSLTVSPDRRFRKAS